DWQEGIQRAALPAGHPRVERAIVGRARLSQAGGPLVPAFHGMKKFVWSETFVQGGQPFSGKLPKPPSISGPYQNIPLFDFLAIISGEKPPAPPEFYADTAVVAFPAPGTDVPDAELRPKVTTSSGNVDSS